MTERAGAYPHGAPWHAVSVHSRREKSAAKWCADRGLESWLPLQRSESRWSDRRKIVERPLLPGYVFVRLDAAGLHAVLRIPGVMQILGSNLNPIPIADEELALFRRVVETGAALRLCAYVAGSKVIVRKGPLAGQSGTVMRLKGQTRLVVSLEMLRRAVSVEIDADCIAAEKTH